MLTEFQDMQGEIFDFCENTGWELFPNEESYSDDEIDLMETCSLMRDC